MQGSACLNGSRRVQKERATQLPNQRPAPLTLSVCEAGDENADAGQGAVARWDDTALQWGCSARGRDRLLAQSTALAQPWLPLLVLLMTISQIKGKE